MATENAHDLIPEELARTTPPLYATKDEADPLVRVKLFTPDSSWTWYVVEYDSLQRLAFGLVCGHEQEFGHFDLAQLETVRGPLGFRIERDLHFEPQAASRCGM